MLTGSRRMFNVVRNGCVFQTDNESSSARIESTGMEQMTAGNRQSARQTVIQEDPLSRGSEISMNSIRVLVTMVFTEPLTTTSMRRSMAAQQR